MVNLQQKITVGIVIAAIVSGVFLAKFYQSPARTGEIYSQALEDYKKNDFANAYFLFSKIAPASNLKPVAVFRQAQCALKLDDKKTALKKYKLIFKRYPAHKLSEKAKYLYAVEVVESNPNLAGKYFKDIIKKYPDSDYAIASEYFLGLIIMNKYQSGEMPTSAVSESETRFRHYLTKAPSGRRALNAVNSLLAVNKKNNSDDNLLIAKVYYLFAEYEKADKILSGLSPQESWALNAQNSYAMKDFLKAKSLTETGLKKYSKYVNEQDIYDVIDAYLQTTESKTAGINNLLAVSSGKGADYLLYLKCGNSAVNEKEACYTRFYNKYPVGKFSADILSNLFFEKIRKKDYENAVKIGRDHLNKFPDAKSSPMVMFWLGKIAQRTNNYKEYNHYYSSVISKYPDSYYAYRAYLNLRRIESPIIAKHIKEKPVEFPYKNSKNNVILKLAELKDYDIINDLTDDGFVKSWVSYQKEDYTKSAIEARNAMEKLSDKPGKHDVRWRLVYPLVYYETTKKYAANAVLMQSILREESYFDPLARSFSGARGLMQLMPATADEIAGKYGLAISSPDDLYNPAINIKLGSYYYLFLKTMLNGYDVSSIAAYNGGIGSLQRWKSSLNYHDTDEFIEQIPYPETQNYVKKVLGSYWNYVRVYSD
ncbi:MAG: transglycosylase SLT domain-containing protein [Heliobacteriaceae bacterium]|jgi:TolA-binding protein|nr:transglycosylase SLT domain-containing protein [Heliobacteriaceae bacterium]